MTVRRIDKDGDWTFGQNDANYISKGDEVRQNVVTRIRSFKYDWYMDTQAHIDWLNILSNLNNRQTIIREIERVTLDTDGVKDVLEISIVKLTQRNATITLRFTTIFDDEFTANIGIL
jgi:hypothetical protein